MLKAEHASDTHRLMTELRVNLSGDLNKRHDTVTSIIKHTK